MEFVEVVKRLQRARIDFFVTGSFAVHLYTNDREYNDIDLTVRESDLTAISKIFGKEMDLDVSPFNETYVSIKVGRVEFATFDIRNGYEQYFFGLDEKYESYKTISYSGVSFKIIDPEELLVLKLFHNRNKNGKRDFDDCKLLVRTLKLNWAKIIILSYKYKTVNNLVKLLLDKEIRKIKINPKLNL